MVIQNNFYIYAWKRLDTNQYFYIGKGSGKRAFNKKNRNNYFKHIINKTQCEVEFLVESLTEDRAFKLEKDLIWCFRQNNQAQANFTDGGEGTCGLKRPDLSLQNSKRLGPLHPCYGKPGANVGKAMSDDIKIKIKKSTLGIKKSTEHKINISLSKLGIKRSDSTIEKMKISKTGVSWGKHTDETKKKISKKMQNVTPSNNCVKKCIEANSKKVVDLSTGFAWDSAKEAADIYRINYNTLRAMLNGNCKNKTNLMYLGE